MTYRHEPVLLAEVMDALKPKEGEWIIDGTLGGAGYTKKIAQAVGVSGKVLALDLDPLALDNAAWQLKNEGISQVHLVQGNFRNLISIVTAEFGDKQQFDGLVLDLGLSSAQLDDNQRGFSFQGDRPLDMAFGGVGQSAVKTTTIVNRYPLAKLAAIIADYGQEPKAYTLARRIVEARKKQAISTTAQLLEVVGFNKHSTHKTHPATKLFQALRMETNQEVAALKEVLEAALLLLRPGGRLVIVSFHSGEDKIVKDFLKQESRDCLCPASAPVCVCEHKSAFQILTKKPIEASEEELNRNPRARSAKLRAARRL